MKATKKDLHESGRPLTKEEFIQKIKDDNNFSNKWGDLGRIYGAQWRNWKTITKKWWDDPEYQGYGADTRSGWEYEETQIDQISELIKQLKENPDSRRLMVNAWAVHDLPKMVLPPCHYGFQVYTRELSLEERAKIWNNTHNPVGNIYTHNQYDENDIPARAISLMFNMRSVDTFLGLPFNIASYGLLLEIISKEVNMVPDELIGNLGDVHLYSNHIEQAKEQIGRRYTHEERIEMLRQAMGEESYQIALDQQVPFGGGLSEYFLSYGISYFSRTREPFPLPTLKFNPCPITGISMEYQSISQFEIENYQSHPTIKAPLSN